MRDSDEDWTIAELISKKKIPKRKKKGQKKKKQRVSTDAESLPDPVENQDSSPGVSLFDDSVDNHFKAIDRVSKLCGEEAPADISNEEIERLSSSITFLREWRQFKYQERVVRFACQSESHPQGKDDAITLPQFSSAAVPKRDGQETIAAQCSNDFVMYAGGPVWALDWCPRVDQRSDCQIKCEFVAVASHAPDSSYHKIGAPVSGRGLIQIWCLLHVGKEDCEPSSKNKRKKNPANTAVGVNGESSQPKKPRGRPRTRTVEEAKSPQAKRGRGRPRKKPRDPNEDSQIAPCLAVEKAESPQAKRRGVRPRKKPRYLDEDTVHVSPLAVEKAKSPQAKRGRGRPIPEATHEDFDVELPESEPNLLSTKIVSVDTCDNVVKEDSIMKNKGLSLGVSTDKPLLTSSAKPCRVKDTESGYCDGQPLLTQNGERESSSEGFIPPFKSDQDPKDDPSISGAIRCPIPGDVALPRLVLGLAHNGKVAWDVKWRPSNNYDSTSNHRMGYLAVLLGSGALEVWEVLLPQTMKVLYSACQKEGTDPRFVKLEPVFKCSKLMRDGIQSIPLTVEWSTSPPHDQILAGCHDGSVAVWKFSVQGTCEDTRPLRCFSADRVPIRSLAWAPPSGSDSGNPNIIVTAGHMGLKFWDLRDPFRPLWDINPFQWNINSLDWLPDPRCILVSLDDGTLRFFSLEKGANDVHVTGKPLVATPQQGFHSYYCSSSAIWSVQFSRSTGMVAYCCADGTTLRFKLTVKAVEKDPRRNRAPHFLCGSLSEEEDSVLTVVTPLLDTPHPMKKSLNESGDTPISIRGFLSISNKEKRAKKNTKKGQSENGQTLALYDGDEPECQPETEDTPENEQTPVSKNSKIEENKDESNVFPPKSVSMHRVRWNVNKGGQRWLCYGGAAGIVRCQEVEYAYT